MCTQALELCRSSAVAEGLKGPFRVVRVRVDASELQLAGHRSVPGDLRCKMLLNLEYLLVVGLKLLTESRVWGKTERKERGTGSESPFSALTQPQAARRAHWWFSPLPARLLAAVTLPANLR